ncbi:plexin-D1-like [Leucoraja erinacea]|uniref:plexin-D1-like n=1 Tax=Leucoraja erinaceus TaxID=7782 RepID=UPI002455218E|nr:plexin-D1-like [Leucoraja erinacea]
MHPAQALRICLLLSSLLLARAAEISYRFESNTNNMAMSSRGGGRVFVASNNSLHQFTRGLVLERWVRTGPRLDGPCMKSQGCCQRWTNTTNVNRILVVDEDHGYLITCGTVRGGACEVRQLSNISDSQQNEKGRVATLDLRASTLAFPVPINNSTHMLTAVTSTGEDSRFIPAGCKGDSSYHEIKETRIFLRSLEGPVTGSLFLNYDSDSLEPFVDLPTSEEHQFVQGFHLNGAIYISVNAANAKVFFAYVSNARQGVLVSISCSLAGSGPLQVLSSALVSTAGSQSFLAAVLSRQEQPQHNALCLFELGRFNTVKKVPMSGHEIVIASDTIDSMPLFSYSGLLSVSATLVRNWAVIFLGAEDGRLIKLVLDENMKVLRPSILIELQDESRIKHSIMFDKIDPHYFYLLTERMVRRLKVANCSQYSSCEDCLSAQDPYCGWCVNEERCSFNSECKKTIWIKFTGQADSCPKVAIQPLAIPDTLDKHFKVILKGNLGNVTREKGECMMRNTKTNEIICHAKYSTYCLCRLSSKTYLQLSNQIDPFVEASFQLTSLNITTKLYNCFNSHASRSNIPCSNCVNSGCYWWATEQKCSLFPNLSKTQACPHVTRAEQSTELDLHIYLKDAEILEKSNLSCVYNGKDELKSTAFWINKFAITCRRPENNCQAFEHLIMSPGVPSLGEAYFIPSKDVPKCGWC